jgi:hypothetical protein
MRNTRHLRRFHVTVSLTSVMEKAGRLPVHRHRGRCGIYRLITVFDLDDLFGTQSWMALQAPVQRLHVGWQPCCSGVTNGLAKNGPSLVIHDRLIGGK